MNVITYALGHLSLTFTVSREELTGKRAPIKPTKRTQANDRVACVMSMQASGFNSSHRDSSR